jgi:hypothetical protein
LKLSSLPNNFLNWSLAGLQVFSPKIVGDAIDTEVLKRAYRLPLKLKRLPTIVGSRIGLNLKRESRA